MTIRARGSLLAASLALCAGSAWVGCGGSASPSITGGDGGSEGSTGEGGSSSGVADSGGSDTGHADTGSTKDSGSSSGVDSGSSSGVDSGSSSGVDSGSSSGVDSGSSSGVDSGSSSGADSGSSSGADSGSSSGADSGMDAGCPAPVTGTLYVAPTGSDATGNGSQTCPFVTITMALSTTTTATGPTTIMVVSGNSATPNVYGAGCTAGGASCDATPIHVTDGMHHGILIEGTSGIPSATVVTGGTTAADDSVFLVNPANVGFQNLTIAPKRVGAGSGSSRVEGTIGIDFIAPPVGAGSEAVITNVVISGIAKSSNTDSTGSGIAMSGGTSPTVGPGVTIVGGDHAVLVTQAASGATPAASHPVITSSAAAPSLFQSTQFACVRVETANGAATVVPTATVTSTSSSDPGRLHLQDCGGNGGVVVDTAVAGTPVGVTNTLIDTSGASAPAFFGIRLQHSGRLTASTAVTITGIHAGSAGGAGIEATDSSVLGISPPSGAGVAGVIVDANAVNGVHIGGAAKADIGGLTSTGNSTGLLCDATSSGATSLNVFLRSSILLENRVYGAFISAAPGGTGCGADLGSNGSAGNNVFNRTSRKNGLVGLCYVPLVPANASVSTWGCGLSAASACAAAATPNPPTPIVAANCQVVGDYNLNASLTVALPQTCCGL